MTIVEYAPERLPALKSCDWDAGRFLAELIEQNRVSALLGEGTRIYFLMDGEQEASFLTLSPQDCIQDPSLTPWIGFVYTFPAYRGRRCAGALIEHACETARAQGAQQVYVATDHTGLYEKYGFVYQENRPDWQGEDSRIYRRAL